MFAGKSSEEGCPKVKARNQLACSAASGKITVMRTFSSLALMLLSWIILSCQSAPALAESSQTQPASGASPDTVPDAQIIDLLQSDQYSQAKKTIESQLKKHDGQRQIELLKLMAYAEHQLKNDRAAIKYLKRLSQSLTGPGSARDEALVLKRIGDLNLKLARYEEAGRSYKDALSKAKEQSDDFITVEVLDPLVGFLIHEGDYKQAAHYAEELLPICKTRAQSGRLVDMASLFWAYVQLSEIYASIDKDK